MSTSGNGSPSIFVVDDEAIISQTLALILQRNGFDARSFTTPAAAIAAASETPPDLLLSDVMMPAMTGVKLAIRFRQLHPGCRVLLFSGQAATSNMLVEARACGYDFEILEKPVHPHDLLAKLRSL